MADGPAAGLERLDALALDDQLGTYPYFHAARADLLRRLNALARGRGRLPARAGADDE